MNSLLEWLEDRTGAVGFAREALYERIPGGARWRYVWGSTLVFAFATQVITGVFLWMCYSPSNQTAWESVYYIQHEMYGGWLLRGLHHFMAQAMVVLLALHLLQVVIDGAYRAPREFNFWIGLILMQIVLGLALTGYLLPWDQKGFWATTVATNLVSLVPFVGDYLQLLLVGGSEYGHQTLTRFFALHAGVLPALLVFFLVLHIVVFRRHGIKTQESDRDDAYFWPEQILRDGVACLAVLIVVMGLCLRSHGLPEGQSSWESPGDHLGAELSAPADGSEQYSAARPEWYFLFLFELLKHFDGKSPLTSEFMGAIVVPGVVMLMLFLMPIVGHWKLGHAFNVVFTFALLVGAAILTYHALRADRYAAWYTKNTESFADSEEQKAYDDAFEASEDYLAAVVDAKRDAKRIKQWIRSNGGIPPEGALALMRSDPETQGPRLFQTYCKSCHSYIDPEGNGIPGPNPEVDEDGNAKPNGGPNLYQFGSREWLAGFLDQQQIGTNSYFGMTAHAEGEMVGFINDLDDDQKQSLKEVVVAISAEAGLVYQQEADSRAAMDGTLDAGRTAVVDVGCTDCHPFRGEESGDAPDLTGYASLEWLVGIISDPAHERFYGDNNDRMPSHHANPDDLQYNLLTLDEIHLLAQWLRGDQKDLQPLQPVIPATSVDE